MPATNRIERALSSTATARKKPVQGSPPRTAADLMDTDFPRLHTGTPLRKAIGTLLTCEGSLPVVDDDGDLVGLFTEKALLELCMPEYTLWPESLAADVCLESLAEPLRGNAESPLADVMLVGGGLTTVTGRTPACEVARLMASRGAEPVLVVEDRRLIGVITPKRLVSAAIRA